MNQDTNNTDNEASTENKPLWNQIIKELENSVETMKQVVLNPGLFFKNLNTDIDMKRGYYFAASMGAISGFIQLIMSIFGLGNTPGFFMSLLFVILLPVIFIIGAYIMGAVFYVFWKFAGSEKNYQVAVICSIFMMATSPFAFILNVLPYLGGVIKIAWLGLLVFHASVHVHKIVAQKSQKLCLVVFGVFLLMTLSMEHSTRKAAVYLNDLSARLETQSAEETGAMVGNFLKGLNNSIEKDRQK